MKNKVIRGPVLVLAVLLALALSGLVLNEYANRKEIAELTRTAYEQKAADASQIQELEIAVAYETTAKETAQQESSSWKEKYEGMEQRFGSLSSEYDTLSSDYTGLQKDVSDIKEEITDYEAKLDESLEWFSYNSVLEHDMAKTYLDIDCVHVGDQACYIKTGCLHLVNTEVLDYRYQYDMITSDEVDKLQSLDEFKENKGGDCEDYALYYKAEWNYLLENCRKDKMVDSIVVESWYGRGNEKHWLDFDKDWYLDDVNQISFSDGKVNPNVVCGTIFDFYRGGYSGHCVIALTDSLVESVDDIDLIDDAIFIEPQTGEHFKIGAPFVMRAGKDPETMDSFIYTVITDNDYFLYNFDKEEWQGYSYFKERLKDIKGELG